jgi:hypothetical protein
MQKAFLLSLLVVLLASCNSVAAITPTSTPKSIETPSPIVTSPPVSPTVTLQIKSPLDSFIQSRTIVAPIGTFRCSDPDSISPSEMWAAIEDAQYGPDKRLLHIINIDQTREWILSYSDICDDICTKKLGRRGSFEIVHWSKDERYLFILPCSTNDGHLPVAGWKGRNLVQIDLLSGKWIITDFGDQVRFSHDGEKLAYVKSGIYIRYLTDGSETFFKIPGEYNGFGEIVWSPDNRLIAFTAAKGDMEISYKGGTFAIYVIDIQKGMISQLPIDEHLCLFPIDWKYDTLILKQSLLCAPHSDTWRNTWQFNLYQKNNLSEATPSP